MGMCLLLQAKSLTVKAALQRVNKASKGKTAAWSVGAAVSGLATITLLTIPVIPVVGGAAIIWGMTAGIAASTTATGVTIAKAAKSGGDVNSAKEGKFNHISTKPYLHT